MKARVPFLWSNGNNLSPTKVNDNFSRISRDAQSSLQRRFGDNSFKLEFSGVADTSSLESKKIRIKAPFAYDISAIELNLYDATGVSVTVSASGVSAGSVSIGPLASAGALVRARATTNLTAHVAANTEVDFLITVTAGGAFTLDRCYAIVSIRSDRAPASTFGPDSATTVASAEAVAAAKINSGLSAVEAAVAADTAADTNMSILVFARRDIPASLPTSDRDLRVASSGRRLHSMDVVNSGGSGDNLTMTVLDENGATVVTATANGTSKTQGTVSGDVQTQTNPGVTTDDYKMRFSRVGSGTIPLGYAVFYYT